MKTLHLACSLGLALAATITASAQPTLASAAAPAVFNTKRFVISDYGALADGKTLNTVAIQKAIDTAVTKGGGLIVVPKGTFMSGSIFMKKGVELWLDEGAVLLGSPNITDYPTMKTRIEGHFPQWTPALVNFPQMDHVRVGGKGQLNGNGPIYYAAFHNAPGAKNLDVPRPRLMFVDRCNDVRIEGISFQDSGFWNLHLYNCREVVIEGLRINAPAGSPSTDGIDVDSCQNVVIRKTQISNNDDNIALKGNKGPLADKDTDSPPVENILIEDCEIGNGNGLITCGSEATIIRNVTVRNCTITGSAWLITLKLRPDTAQHYSNITIDGIKLTGHANLLNVAPWWMYFDLKGQPAPSRSVDNIVIRNVTGAASFFGGIRGNLPNAERGTLGDSIGSFTLENINLTMSNPAPLSRGEMTSLVFKNVIINGKLVEAPPATPVPAPAKPAAVLVKPVPEANRIILVGDSTVASGSGWGDAFSKLLAPGVECLNKAIGGRSSKSYRDEGHWQKALDTKPGWVLIQFGHNDQPGKGPERETDAKTTFRENLARYIAEARAIGAKPVLVTPLTRRNFNAQGKIDPSHLEPNWDASGGMMKPDFLTDYVAAAEAVAAEQKVPLIDLNARSIEQMNQIGPEGAIAFDAKSQDPAKPDKTHLSPEGATKTAALVADEIRKKIPELAGLLRP